MKKRLVSLLAIVFFITCTGAVIAAPAPAFVDVPAKHWAYEAVAYLAQTGIVDGYDDKTFRGDKTMSRYEMAQIVYKAVLKQNQANVVQKAVIDKLAAEFALEMTKIEDIDKRLAKVEQNQPTVKMSGRILEQWKVKTFELPNHTGWATGQWQVRLNASAMVDQDTTAFVRLANPAPSARMFHDGTANYVGDNGNTSGSKDDAFRADRFYATTKAGAVSWTLGRQAFSFDPEDLLIDGDFFSYDGLKATGKFGGVNFDVKHGRFFRDIIDTYKFSGKPAASWDRADFDYIKLGSQYEKWTYDVAWANFKNTKLAGDKTLMTYQFADAYYTFNDAFSMGMLVGKNTKAPTGGNFWLGKAVYGAQSLNAAGKQNFTVTYMHSGLDGVNFQFTSFDQPDEGNNGDSYNNLDLAYRFAVSKSMILKAQYGKVMDKTDNTQSYHLWKLQAIYKF